MLFIETLKLHIELARKNLIAVIIILISCISIIESSIAENVLLHGIGYMAAIWLSMYITDVVVQWKPKMNSIGFPIKKPVGMELWTIFICTALGLGFLIFRFATDWENLNNVIKLA